MYFGQLGCAYGRGEAGIALLGNGADRDARA